MLPKNLTLQAFGAYPDRVTIPFKNLGASNLYLITGVTGSGKTTIFDAIVFALYNDSSGSNRTNATLRSHFAKDETESFVEFEFLYNGELYKIKRCPSYERKKARGEGVIQEQAKAELYLPDGKILSKVQEVDNYIISLLGVNKDQFSQIALLAQGEFLKLLNADTKTRSEIFRNLFKTSAYSVFQEEIKKEFLKIKSQYDNLKLSILQYLNQIEVEKDLLETKNLFIKNAEFIKLDEFLANFQNYISEKKNELKENKNKEKKLSEEKEKLLIVLKEIENIKKLSEQYKKLTDSLKEKQEEFKEIKKEYLNIGKYQKEAEVLKEEIKAHQKTLEKIDEIFANDKETLKLKNEQNSLKLEADNLETKNKEYKFAHIKQKESNISELENNIKNYQKEFIEIEKILKEKELDYNNKYHLYLSNQAGILAQTLKESFPCPVCGAKNHPNPARNIIEKITSEELENIKNDIDKKKETISNILNSINITKEKINNLKKETEELKKKYCLKETFEIKISNLNYANLILENDEKIIMLQEKINALSLEIKAFEAKNEILKKDIKTSDIKKEIEINEKNQTTFKNLNSKIQLAQENYQTKNEEIISQKARLEEIKRQIKTKKNSNLDEEKYKNSFLTLAQEIKEIKTTQETLIKNENLNEKLFEKLNLSYLNFQKTQKDYLEYQTLSNLANGNLAGKSKVTFEQYIQSYYLDMVLFEANKHLKIMTQNQFQLQRKKETSSKQTKSALDIEVMDFHTFKKRSTKTLSGGESFKAALCLALGLADTISLKSGGVNINSMFIDEGFGSLDSASIETALEVIISLADTNRLIGIISHVEDLKEKIENQILSIKTNSGSSVKINF